MFLLRIPDGNLQPGFGIAEEGVGMSGMGSWDGGLQVTAVRAAGNVEGSCVGKLLALGCFCNPLRLRLEQSRTSAIRALQKPPVSIEIGSFRVFSPAMLPW